MTVFCPTSGKAAGVIPPMAASTGPSPATSSQVSSAAIQCCTRMKPAGFFTTACFSHFVITSTARQTAANRGCVSSLMEVPLEVTSSGSPLIERTARATVSNTKPGVRQLLAAVDCSTAPPMAVLHGRVRLACRIRRVGEHLTWLATATSSLAATMAEAVFGASVRPMRKTRL